MMARRPFRIVFRAAALTTISLWSPVGSPSVLGVTRTAVQLGDPDIGDQSPKRAKSLKVGDAVFVHTNRPSLTSWALWFEIYRAMYFRIPQ